MADTTQKPSRGKTKHPPVLGITDSLTFRLSQLVAISERAAQYWLQSTFGLTLNKWRVIGLISARGPLRAGAVSDALMMDKSQLSRLLHQLSADGLIESREAENDARAINLSLTADGVALHDRVLKAVVAANERFIEPLSRDEFAQLSDMLTRLTDHNRHLLDRREEQMG